MVYRAIVCVALLLAACGGDGEDGPAAAGRGGEGGSKAPGNLPNLSTAGKAAEAGAGGSSEQCKFLELGPCVSSALDEAVNCLQAGRVGVFSQDRTTCTFDAADATAQFTEPVRRGSRGFQLDFDLRVGDHSCLRFSQRDAEAPYVERFELITASHNVNYLHGFERRLECDGQAYEYKGTDQSACPPGSILELPMPMVSEMASAIAFEFSRPGRISRVFLCNAP